MKTSGWAVTRDGLILVDTVSITRKAAIVNYLVVYQGEFITRGWATEDIKRAWDYADKRDNIEIVEVIIDVKEGAT